MPRPPKRPPSHDPPAGYLITFTTYGERLHGDPRGSVERMRTPKGVRELKPNAAREAGERARLATEKVLLDEPARATVASTIQEVCEFRGWRLHAVNVRTNHVHVVVSGPDSPERMMNAFKAWSTRRLREAGLLDGSAKVWTRHGSTPHLWTEGDIERVSGYVVEGQGEDIGGLLWGTGGPP